MTLEEKIARLQETVMTEARSEGNAIIDNHKKALESLFEKQKKEATAPNLVKCSKCGELMMPHRVCKACGSYNKREIVTVEN